MRRAPAIASRFGVCWRPCLRTCVRSCHLPSLRDSFCFCVPPGLASGAFNCRRVATGGRRASGVALRLGATGYHLASCKPLRQAPHHETASFAGPNDQRSLATQTVYWIFSKTCQSGVTTRCTVCLADRASVPLRFLTKESSCCKVRRLVYR